MKQSKKPKIVLSRVAKVVSFALVAQHSWLYAADNTNNSEDGVALERIEVTAERRSESIQETPMSVTAFTGDMIDKGAISNIDDVSTQTPNFKMTTFNISEPQLYIRGIGTTNDSIGADPAVAVFVDEVYLGRPSGTPSELYDLDRIEILRGPQGTLYGRNAVGGAINIYTKKPQQDFEAKAGFTAGNYGLLNFRGYVNGSISDTVAGKITVNTTDRDGYAKNITTGQDLEDDNSTSIRGQLLIEPSDGAEWLIGFDYTDVDNAGSNRNLRNIQGPFAPPQQAEVDKFDDDPRKSNTNEKQYANKELFGLMVRANIDTDWGTFSSITSYRDSKSAWKQALVPLLSTQDGGSGLYEVNDIAKQQADQVSQEFRLSSETDQLKWVAGLFYFKENADKTEQFQTYWDASVAVIPDLGPALVGSSPGDVSFIQEGETKSMALFGQTTWSLADSLALTTGIRYTKDKKEITNIATAEDTGAPLPGIPLFPGSPYSVDASKSWSNVSYRATLDWDITDSHMLYVTYSEGFKSGAYNFQQSNSIVAATPIQPELATNYEIGFRSQWLDDRIRFNMTYFQLDFEDLQTFSLNDTLELIADNATAELSGVEANFALAITEDFTLTGSLATLDGEFTEGSNEGKILPRSPELSWSLNARYVHTLSNGADLDFSATASYTDEYHYELNNNPLGLEEDVTLLDLSVKYLPEHAKWDMMLWVKNATDELYSVHHIDGTLGGESRIYAPPRTYGLSFNYYWD